MQNIDNSSKSESRKKEIIIHLNYDEKDIVNDIEKCSEKYNLKSIQNTMVKHNDIGSQQYSEKDIEKIEKDVVELVEVFNTVQDMVSQQKDNIDTIATCIDNTSEYIVIAQDDLDEIEKINKGINNKKTIIYSVGVIIISIPISVLAGPIMGVAFAALGVGGLKGYSIYNKNNLSD